MYYIKLFIRIIIYILCIKVFIKSRRIVINGRDNSVDCSPLKSVKHYFISPTFLFSIHNSVASSMYRYRNNIIHNIISYAAVYNTIHSYGPYSSPTVRTGCGRLGRSATENIKIRLVIII